MRRIFEDQQGNESDSLICGNTDTTRASGLGIGTMKADRSLASSPYPSFSIGAPVITVSTPLRGKVPGVIAADFELDTFNDFVQAQRPGEHGIVLIFDSTGSLIAHPNFAQFVVDAMTHPSQPQLPNIKEINSGVVAAVLRRSDGRDHYDGSIRDDQGRDYLFRVAKFTLGEQYNANILLLAAEEDFVQGVRRLQFAGLILAIVAGAAFIPVIWIFGSGMSRSLKIITAEAVNLQTLAGPTPRRSLHALRKFTNSAMRWSSRSALYGRSPTFSPKEIVQRIIDNSISTELGGVRDRLPLFSPTQGFSISPSPPTPIFSCNRRHAISPSLQRLSSPKAEQSTSSLVTP